MRIFASSSTYDFEGECEDDVDLDGAFKLVTLEGEVVILNGWLFDIERVDADQSLPGSTEA
jgi:hypothetical protein